MIVLGLDPGSRFTGYGFLVAEGSRVKPLTAGRIRLPSTEPLPVRLAHLVEEVEKLLEQYRPEIAAIERPFHGASSSSLIVLAQARGALLATVARRGIAVREYAPAEVKSALASGRADKQQVARMVALLLGIDASALPPDATDALAVALCCVQRRRAETLDPQPPARKRARTLVALTAQVRSASVTRHRRSRP